jgi:apolipoprotein N-acyltransferase
MIWLLLSALLLTTSFLFAYPLIFVAFVPLLFAQYRFAEKRRWSTVFLTGWASMTLFYAVSLWWMWTSSAFATAVFVLLWSLFFALVLTLPWLMRPTLGVQRSLIALPFFWMIAEWLQQNYSFGVMTLGNILPASFTGWYEHMGVLGGSFWIWSVNLAAFYILRTYLQHKQWRPLAGQSVLWLGFLIILPVCIGKVYGQTELQGRVVEVGAVGSGFVEVEPAGNKSLTLDLLFVPFGENIFAPEVYRKQVRYDVQILHINDVDVPDKIRRQQASLRARETQRPVLWDSPAGVTGVDARGNVLEPDTLHEVVLPEKQTYFVRVGSFPLRMSLFVAIFMVLYMVSFSLRGAKMSR